MAWVTDLSKRPKSRQSNHRFHNRLSNNHRPQNHQLFFRLRLQLLLIYSIVMAASLVGFGVGVYGFVVNRLYQQLDKRLLTLAQSGTPTHSDIRTQGSGVLDSVSEVPWRDIFNRDQQSLEWFDVESQLLASKGTITIARPPRLGAQTLRPRNQPFPVRTYSISVFSDNPDSPIPVLEGYVRASQSMEDVLVAQQQLLWGLGLGGGMALVCMGVGGLWLTERALIPVKRSFNQLRQFTADASHELRSPLTVMQGFVELMEDHPERVHPADVKKLESLASATHQMTSLTEDLLLLARDDAGGELSMKEYESLVLKKFLAGLVEEYQDTAQKKQIELKLHCHGELQTGVSGHPIRLRRLFVNLLDNALHYTPTGGDVTVSVERSGRWVMARVSDTGIGIPSEHLDSIFQRFWRAEAARSHRHNGSGLGLAIAQTIARQHQGEISVTSTIGKGSCFKVSLPWKPMRNLSNHELGIEV